MAKELERVEGALWGREDRSGTTYQQMDRMLQVSQQLMDLQEAAATAGAQYVLARLRACRPE